MTRPGTEPKLTKNGVVFTVMSADFIRYDCVISKEALAALPARKTGSLGPMEIFHAYEAKILGVARRLIAANVKATPLQLEPHSFH